MRECLGKERKLRHAEEEVELPCRSAKTSACSHEEPDAWIARLSCPDMGTGH